MKPAAVINAIEEFAPRALQENWDNTGLQIAFPEGADCTGVLLCVDVTEDIIAEAVEVGCNLVVSHHPLIFKGLRSLTGRTPAERAAMEAIRAGVAVYSSHTALDSTRGGVSYAMAAMLGAEVVQVLSPADLRASRIEVICPRHMAADVRLALLDGGAGVPLRADADPSVESADIDGYTLGNMHPGTLDLPLTHTPLTRVEATVPATSVESCVRIISGLAAPVRYTITPLDNRDRSIGLGVIAEYTEPVAAAGFLAKIRETFGTPAIRANAAFAAAVADPAATVRRIALCGGSGGEFIAAAESARADVFVTADIRYHDFADHRCGTGLVDIGHFESESCAKDIFYHVLTKKFPNFAVRYSQLEKNPVHYL